jgi:periplasmic copper chaperone A
VPTFALPRRRPRVGLVVVVLAVLLSACGGGGDPSLRVNGPAQAAQPVSGASQIVVEIANDGDGDDTLVDATTDVALGIEMHLTTIEDGRASMGQLDEVELPAGETVSFRPGGLHLMLIVPDETVTQGTTFEMTLRFERSEDLTVPVTVVDLLDLAESTFDDPDAADPDAADPDAAGDADPTDEDA